MASKVLSYGLQRRVFIPVIIAAAIVGILVFASFSSTLLLRAANKSSIPGASKVFAKLEGYEFPWTGPNVEWASASPESLGMDGSKLNALIESLSERDTQAFIVVKNDQIVAEWYGDGQSANKTYSIAALAKATTGSVALMLAVNDDRISLDDPAWKYIPNWEADTQKSKITIGQLGSHTAGLDDVWFAGEIAPGWKLTYFENRDQRFSMALNDVPVFIEPGIRYSYSGVGYYALAYAITRSLQDAPESDILTLLESRITEPLGIPGEAWGLSYGESYELDDLKLYAAGSGSKYTPRAVARMGQLMLNNGEWNGRQLIRPEIVKAFLAFDSSGEESDELITSIGWKTNANGRFASLPADAFWGQGIGDQILLVIPSLDIVLVRLGRSLADDPNDESASTQELDDYLFGPLVDAVN